MQVLLEVVNQGCELARRVGSEAVLHLCKQVDDRLTVDRGITAFRCPEDHVAQHAQEIVGVREPLLPVVAGEYSCEERGLGLLSGVE